VWEPLLAIADLAGGDWPERARKAAIALSSGEERDDDSVTALLIRDSHGVFVAKGEHLKTTDLLEGLHQIEESPWGDWYGKPLSAHGLSRLLKPYRIRTMPVYSDGKTVRGYKADQFADAFQQFGLPSVRSVRCVRHEGTSEAGANAPNASNASTAGVRSNGRRPLPGDAGYPTVLARAFENGHVTEQEMGELFELHRALAGALEESAALEAESSAPGSGLEVGDTYFCDQHKKLTVVRSVAAGLTYLACGCHLVPGAELGSHTPEQAAVVEEMFAELADEDGHIR
jgi:hypothetical protein